MEASKVTRAEGVPAKIPRVFLTLPPEQFYQVLAYVNGERASARAAGIAEGREQAAVICDEQEQVFLSPEYATHQPLSSMMERFACKQCAAAIRKGPDHAE